MDGIGSLKILEVVSQFGLPGVLLVIWYWSDRSREKMLQRYRDDMQTILRTHEQRMSEMRQMYENNVELVKDYRRLAMDQREVITLNTQTFTRLTDAIEKNQFCPMVRLEKAAPGPVTDRGMKV
jgi:hypothetical protein